MKITAVESEVRKTIAEKNESHNKGGSSENSKLGENIEHIGESELDENIAYIEESKLGEIIEYIEESMNGVEENAYSADGEGIPSEKNHVLTQKVRFYMVKACILTISLQEKWSEVERPRETARLH